MASTSYTFTANCTYDREYVRAGQTVVGGPAYSVLPRYVIDNVAGVQGAPLPAVLPPHGGGNLSFQPHSIAR
jgi:hypothetical protein